MKDWKLAVKNIVINAADYADDAVDFTTTIKSYKLSYEDLRELGFECMLEINNCRNISVLLFTNKNEAIEKLMNSWKIFGLSHKVIDEYIRPDNMYAYSDTKNDDIMYRADITMF